MHTTRRWRHAAAASGVLGTLLLAIGCSGVPTQAPQPQATASVSQAGVPVVVSCEPGQRTIVKPTIVNGAAMSQVECVAAEIAQPVANAQPVAYSQLVAYAQPVAYARPLGQSPSPSPIATPVVARTTAPSQVTREVADTEFVPVSTALVGAPGEYAVNWSMTSRGFSGAR